MRIAAALLLPLLLLSGCSQGPKIPEVPAEAGLKAPGPIQITLTPAQEKSIALAMDTAVIQEVPSRVTLTGRVQAAAPLLTHSYSLVSGQAVQVPVSIGQVVMPGQVLAVLRSDAIGQMEGELLQSMLQVDEDIREAQVQMEYSRKAFEREDQLFKAKVSARAEVESASAQYTKDALTLNGLRLKRQATIKTYQERLSLLGLAPVSALQVVDTRHIDPYTSIRAPRGGLVVARNINTGELVDTTKELFQIADLSKVWIVGDVFEKDIHRIQKGESVEIHLDGFPDTKFSGVVNLVDSMLDPQTRTLEIRVEVSNPHALLKPNMFARMNILTGQDLVLSVPKSAIQQSGDHTYVYVQTALHQYEERSVTVHLTDEDAVEVLQGLKAGEQVVSNGSLALKGEALKLSGK
jgi:cobalt-zinc-cadmium efflux system membrane fusion protein